MALIKEATRKIKNAKWKAQNKFANAKSKSKNKFANKVIKI